MGGAAPPFLSVPGKFISSARLQARQVALLTLNPIPKSPRAQARQAGYRESKHRLRPLCDLLELAWVWGKVPGVVAATVCAEREVAPGDLGRWAGRPGCGWSGELLRWG